MNDNVCLDCPFFDRSPMKNKITEHHGRCILDNKLVYAWTYQKSCRNQNIILKARVIKK